MRYATIGILTIVALLALPALAQAPTAKPQPVRGTVERLDGQTLMVKSRDGQDLKVVLAPNYAVSAVIKQSMADIHPGSFLASASVKGTDGKLHAVGVTILPDALRGQVPELQTPWDLSPGSVMTNAIVTGMVDATNGNAVKMTYKGNETEVVIGPDASIVTSGPGDSSLLKPGATVFIFAQKQPDGTLSAARVTAEKDGVKPPM